MKRLSNKKKNEARSPLKYIKIETKQKISNVVHVIALTYIVD